MRPGSGVEGSRDRVPHPTGTPVPAAARGLPRQSPDRLLPILPPSPARSPLRALVRFLVLVALLGAAALVVGDQLVEARVRGSTAKAFDGSLSSPDDLDVDLTGSPLLYRLSVGRFPAARVTARNVVVGLPPVTLARVELDLREVRFDQRQVLAGELRSMEVGSGTVTAVVDEREVQRLVEAHRPEWDVDLQAGELTASTKVAGIDVRITADARLAGDQLEFVSRRVSLGALGRSVDLASLPAFDLRLPLPPLASGMRFETVDVEPDALVLRGSVPRELHFG